MGQRARELARYLLRSGELYLFVLPAVIHVLLFRYLPIYGLRIAFTNGFSLRTGRSAPEWNEFAHFIRYFDSAYFIPVIRNTIVIVLYSLEPKPTRDRRPGAGAAGRCHLERPGYTLCSAIGSGSTVLRRLPPL